MHAWFHRTVLSRPWLTFIVMGVSFFAFGVGSLNLFHILRANTSFLFEYGAMALLDGGLRQLSELLATGYASLAAYTVFKACEHALVERTCTPPAPPALRSEPPESPTP